MAIDRIKLKKEEESIEVTLDIRDLNWKSNTNWCFREGKHWLTEAHARQLRSSALLYAKVSGVKMYSRFTGPVKGCRDLRISFYGRRKIRSI